MTVEVEIIAVDLNDALTQLSYQMDTDHYDNGVLTGDCVVARHSVTSGPTLIED